MNANAITAALAYARTLGGAAQGDAAAESGAAKPDFGSMVQETLSGAAGAVQGAEKAGLQAVTGKADIADVVAAVTDAELALETVVAVRDRVINAYQEIMRMPI